MSLDSKSSKIKQTHLDRLAVVYIRQSTNLQVKYNTASTERQRALRKRAAKLGWDESRIVVNDLDLGKSGASTYKRDGFKQVRELVKSKQVGAVFILGASRLSREVGNFSAFIRLCYYKDTLIIDEDAEYDTHILHDRTTLGFQGMMADLERSNILENFRRAREIRATTGALRHPLPAGYVYNKARKIVFNMKEKKKVHGRVKLFFDTFERLGSARAVVNYFRENKLTIPTTIREAELPNKTIWVPLTNSRAVSMLHTPTYAGTYTHGRFEVKEEMVSDDIFEIKFTRVKVGLGQCRVVIHDHHPAYITWKQYLKNEQRLKANRWLPQEGSFGAPREGAALLQGRLRCAKCHNTMYVMYIHKGTIHHYTCCRERLRLAVKNCQSFTGPCVDEAVTQLLLRAFEPAQLTLALQTLASVEEQINQLEEEWETRLDGVRSEAAKAERRYKVAADRNKSSRVTLQLLDEWERSDAEVRNLERECQEELKCTPHSVSSKERQTILALARDIPAVWNAQTTDMVARKKILQAAISHVAAERVGSTIHLKVHWVTGASHALKVTLPTKNETLRTDPQIIESIRELGTEYKAREIADILNKAGRKTKQGKQFTDDVVRRLRHRCRFLGRTDQSDSKSGDMYTMQEAAKVLGMHPNTVALWRQQGRFECTQEYPGGPWIIKLTPSMIEDIKTNGTTRWSKLGEAHYQKVSHKVVKAYDDGVGTQAAIAEMFGVSRAFVVICLRRRRETGRPHGTSIYCGTLDARAMQLIKTLVAANPIITYRELQRHIQEKRGISATLKMVEKAIFRLGLQRKRQYL